MNKQKKVAIPNPRNFCGGNFQDWLEVMLIDKCNGRCSWCIDKNGHHPKRHLHWVKLAWLIIKSDRSNIILLGGEPTLYKKLRELIVGVVAISNKKIYLTTNGSMLSPLYVDKTLYRLTGINISIHHYNLEKNHEITGISLKKENLINTIKELHKKGITVRLNCNLINGYIDSKQEILSYINFAKEIGADNIRFAELKNDKDSFVDLMNIFPLQYGINADPFFLGCNSNAKINGMPINFRQMCGLQTDQRPEPINPEQKDKIVLYYDGIFYNGWQPKREELWMATKKLKKILNDVSKNKKSSEEAQIEVEQCLEGVVNKIMKKYGLNTGGCKY